jgi:mannosyltransferase
LAAIRLSEATGPVTLDATSVACVAATAAATAFLAVRVVPDVTAKPLFEDEAVAGLVAARPLPELLQTVMEERGGSPLHFVLAHASLALDPSAFALRWLAVLFALATIPLCFDIGRRLAGPLAGGVAAWVAASSSLLGVYGSFGRMYSLYAFAAALAVDLFLVALERRTATAAFVAALAAWLVPAVHPYGGILVAAELIVALFLWRGRGLRAALPVAAVGVAMIPFAWADLRLAERFSVGTDGEARLAAPSDAWNQLGRALAASAGGQGVMFMLALALVGIGALVLARSRTPFVAVAAAALLAPPVLLVLLRSEIEPELSPRHLMYALPLAAAFIGAAVARMLRDAPIAGRAVALGLLLVIAFLAPFGGIRDPRNWPNDVLGGGPSATALGSEARLADPSTWLRRTVEAEDVLYPYSPVFLGALDVTRRAHTLPYSQTSLVLRSLERIDSPVERIIVSVPVGDALLDLDQLRERLGSRFEPHPFGPWLLIEGRGPFFDDHTVLVAIYHALASARSSILAPKDELTWYFRVTLSSLCGSVRAYGDSCPPRWHGR